MEVYYCKCILVHYFPGNPDHIDPFSCVNGTLTNVQMTGKLHFPVLWMLINLPASFKSNPSRIQRSVGVNRQRASLLYLLKVSKGRCEVAIATVKKVSIKTQTRALKVSRSNNGTSKPSVAWVSHVVVWKRMVGTVLRTLGGWEGRLCMRIWSVKTNLNRSGLCRTLHGIRGNTINTHRMTSTNLFHELIGLFHYSDTCSGWHISTWLWFCSRPHFQFWMCESRTSCCDLLAPSVYMTCYRWALSIWQMSTALVQ